jgi:large subunit ribosomal protein L15
MRQYFEGGQLPMVRRLPFKRGFNNPFRVDYQEVNLWLLERIFEEGATVNPQTMAAAGIIRDAANPIAVLGAGAEKLTKKLNITATRFSASAKARVEALGGTIEIIPIRIRGIHARVRKLRQYREDELYGKVE